MIIKQNSSKVDLLHKLMGKFVGYWLQEVRHVSKNTVKTYKDSYKSFMRFYKERYHITVSKLSIEHFNRDRIAEYLVWLKDNKCSQNTINLRLIALKSFAEFAMEEDPEVWEYMKGIVTIRTKKESKKREIKHLTKTQVTQLLELPDLTTRIGKRDYVLIATLYNTGARISELLNLKLKDVIINGSRTSARLTGKGNKTRIIPLEGIAYKKNLKIYLKLFHSNSKEDDFLFYTNYGEIKSQMKRNSVDALLKKYASKAKALGITLPTLHAHMLRHSRAMHLHESGMSIIHIKDFLGHESLTSTSIYAWSDLKTLRKALKKVTQFKSKVIENEENGEFSFDAKAIKIMCLD